MLVYWPARVEVFKFWFDNLVYNYSLIDLILVNEHGNMDLDLSVGLSRTLMKVGK